MMDKLISLRDALTIKDESIIVGNITLYTHERKRNDYDTSNLKRCPWTVHSIAPRFKGIWNGNAGDLKYAVMFLVDLGWIPTKVCPPGYWDGNTEDKNSWYQFHMAKDKCKLGISYSAKITPDDDVTWWTGDDIIWWVDTYRDQLYSTSSVLTDKDRQIIREAKEINRKEGRI